MDETTGLNGHNRKRTPHIADPNLLALMAELEGPSWQKDQERRRPNAPHSVNHARAAWQEKQREFAHNEDIDWRDLLESPASVVLYGAGGYHRYIVGADGTVRFSTYHAREVNVAKAKALGFELC